jgi:hypothetical protein
MNVEMVKEKRNVVGPVDQPTPRVKTAESITWSIHANQANAELSNYRLTYNDLSSRPWGSVKSDDRRALDVAHLHPSQISPVGQRYDA